MKIIAIDDNKAGHKSQLKGIIGNLEKQKNYKISFFTTGQYFFSFLSNSLANIDFFIPKKIKKQMQSLIKGEKQVVIIAIGRRTLASCLYLKKIAKKNNIQVRLIYLMPPAKNSEIDLVFFHSYKQKNNNYSKNYIPIAMPPHNLDVSDLYSEDKALRCSMDIQIDSLAKPVTTILIGGNAKGIKFSKNAVDDLIKQLKHVNKTIQGSFIVITSRRTPKDIAVYFNQEMQKYFSKKFFFYNYNEDSDKGNPYKKALAIANVVIVTGESISMLAECCALRSSTKVLVFFSKNFYSKRYVGFHKILYKNNYAHPLEKGFRVKSLVKTRTTINTTQSIVDAILNYIEHNFKSNE